MHALFLLRCTMVFLSEECSNCSLSREHKTLCSAYNSSLIEGLHTAVSLGLWGEMGYIVVFCA